MCGADFNFAKKILALYLQNLWLKNYPPQKVQLLTDQVGLHTCAVFADHFEDRSLTNCWQHSWETLLINNLEWPIFNNAQWVSKIKKSNKYYFTRNLDLLVLMTCEPKLYGHSLLPFKVVKYNPTCNRHISPVNLKILHLW